MKRLILIAALLAAPAAAQQAATPEPQALPQLGLEQKTLLRCSAAFAIIAAQQKAGVASAAKWPALGERGMEYFVQAGAELARTYQLTHEQIDALYRAESKRLIDESAAAADPQAFVNNLMQPCLLSLDASGL